MVAQSHERAKLKTFVSLSSQRLKNKKPLCIQICTGRGPRQWKRAVSLTPSCCPWTDPQGWRWRSGSCICHTVRWTSSASHLRATCPLFCRHTVSWVTSAWNLHRGSCWGIPSCRCGCLPARRYTAAGAGPGGDPSTLHEEKHFLSGELHTEKFHWGFILVFFFYLVSWSHLGWCILQSVDESTWGWPSVCSDFPAGD